MGLWAHFNKQGGAATEREVCFFSFAMSFLISKHFFLLSSLLKHSHVANDVSLIPHTDSYWKRNWLIKRRCLYAYRHLRIARLPETSTVTALSNLDCARPIRLHCRRVVFSVYLYDNRLLAHSVMHICIRGLPSRIFNAAHTFKFITPMTDGALPTKHGLSESFNRVTGLRSPLKKQHKLGFSQIQLWQFQDQNYGSTTSKSVIQSTYYNSRFSEIRIWISILLVDWSDQLPNWLRRWVFDNRSELDYGLDERNSVAHHYN